MHRTLFLDIAASTQSEGKLEPVTEFLLFRYGANETTQGTITLDEASAKKVMAAYEKRNRARKGDLDIDFFHLSRKENARLEDRRSAGRCKLELREDGIWCTDIRPTAEARAMLEADQVRSYSPVVSVSAKGVLLEIVQMSLTNIPAMDDAGLLAAEDVLDDDALTLSVTPFQSFPLYEGATWDARAADQRLRQFLSSDGTDDLSKVDMTRYRKAFVFYDGDAPESTSRYKGQILDVQDIGNGLELVVSKKAVQTLGALIQGSRGGINLSDADREKGKTLLSRYYKLFDSVAPWDREQKPAPAEEATEEPQMLETPRVNILMLEAKWSNEMRDMLRKAVGYRFGEHSYIDDWSADRVRVCAYGEGPMPSKMFEMPYTVSGDKIELGEPVEVKVSYVPVAKAAEVMAMQDRLSTAHVRLLEVTGVQSTSEALVKLEALQRDAAKMLELQTQLQALEDREYTRERDVLISKAKAEGKWTLALEQQGDRHADMAKRLGEGRVKALESHWESVAPVIHQGREQQARHEATEMRLEESTEAILREHAIRLKMPYETVRAEYLKGNK